MALNKFMHPRNIYKTPPNFEKLSKTFPEFSKIAKMDVTGKVTIDFKDSHSLRVLTKCLMKSDFNLDVEIPEDRLVPTLPLRVNYILWIEDMMAAIKKTTDIRGIDIGTGACAVYPLLAAVKNKWHMLATETDDVSLQKAKENIERNHLEQLIQLDNNKGEKLIESLFSEESNKFDFCMCNPPFYSNLQELYESRSPARLPPKNGFTGSPQELITEGGELKFCRQLIDESKRCKDKVLIFTTMVGHKYNLAELLQDLKADGIKHTHTEFCQGRVTRWGLAWTYQDYDLYNLVPPRNKPRKKTVPITYELPPLSNCDYNVEAAYNRIKSILSDLQIKQKILNKCGNHISLDVIAKKNTWSNQRRKRRLMRRMEAIENKRMKSDDGSPKDSNAKFDGSVEKCDEVDNVSGKIEDTLKVDNNNKEFSASCNIKSTRTELSSGCNSESSKTILLEESVPSTNNTIEVQGNVEEGEPLIHAFMKLFKREESVHLQIEIVNGTGGKESVHQVVQYIKNNWKW